MSHMVTSEENMINLKGAEICVNVGDSRTLIGKQFGNWNIYQKRDNNIHHVTLSDISVILGLQNNIFSVRRAPQKSFQVTSEGKALILEKFSTRTCFYEKMVNHSVKGCI